MNVQWSDRAQAKAQAILIENGKDLWDEAERITRRAEADTVSAVYVESASRALRLRRPGTWAADVLMVLGPLLVGIAVGPALTFSSGQWPYDDWVAYGTVAFGGVGLILTTWGAVLKAFRR